MNFQEKLHALWFRRILSWRFLQQFVALYRKNALVAWRNRGATAVRLIAPFVFLLLALFIQKALDADTRRKTGFADIATPDAIAVPSIPDCNSDFYIGSRSCYTLLYTYNDAATQADVDGIVANIKANNVPPIPDAKVMSIAGRAAADAYMLANPETVLSVVHFIRTTSGANDDLSFLLQFNTTSKFFKGNYQDPNFFVEIPVASAVQREIARWRIAKTDAVAAAGLVWSPTFYKFPHPALDAASVLGYVIGPFIFAACMFSFVAQSGVIAMEKEQGLRQALRNMGMRDSAFWASWAAWDITFAFFTAHVICVSGLIMQFDMFLRNSYGLLWMLFFLFQLPMSGLAYMLTAILKNSQSAMYSGFGIFLIGWILQIVVIFGVPFTPEFVDLAGGHIARIFAAFPWDLLVKGTIDLSAATNSAAQPGLKWEERDSYCRNIPDTASWPAYDPKTTYINFKCVYSLDYIYKIFVLLYAIFFATAIYLDNVLANENGVSRRGWYLFTPGYWFPRPADSREALRAATHQEQRGYMMPAAENVEIDEDVASEEQAMRELLAKRLQGGGEKELTGANGRYAVETYGLRKHFAGAPRQLVDTFPAWFPRSFAELRARGPVGKSGVAVLAAVFLLAVLVAGSTLVALAFVPVYLLYTIANLIYRAFAAKPDPFWAVRGSWFSIEEDQLFCLLGPNGAGKTTTIKCLTGALPFTGGDALVYGGSISSEGGMDQARALMGVCPQFDILWNELNGREHLQIYGAVKGIAAEFVDREAEVLLEKVKLSYAAELRSGAYSGGMKRRLSVAIALLGDPKVVFLDEPTTGMDPISRRYVWDIIQEAKAGRAIILTTHSMEEADILGDRIAIMARGRLRCIGSSTRLKQRFGAGYQVSVSVLPVRGSQLDLAGLAERASGVKAYFKTHLGVDPVDENRAYTSFLVERGAAKALVDFLGRLEGERSKLGITDVQLSLTSLEEVFLAIAKQAEVEAAAGTLVPITLDDGTKIEVPMGQELYSHPRTGAQFVVVWGQDEDGRLVVIEARHAEPAGPRAEGVMRLESFADGERN